LRERSVKKEGEEKGSARGSVHWGCYYATALDIEVDPQRRRFGFRFKRAAFYMGLKSKVGLVAAKASGVTDQPQYPRL
jgi:hypothetical protein